LTESEQKKKSGLPLWASLLICLVVLTIGTVSTTVFSWLMFARQIVVDANVPEKMQATAKQIAQFPQPLPDGYKYMMAANFEIMQCLVIEHEPTHQQIAFYTLPGQMSEQDSKNFLDRAYDAGINTTYLAAKFHGLKSRGTVVVLGQQMNYLMGEFTDLATNRKADGMVGTISVKKAAKNILIYSYPDRDHAYNQQVTLNLLNSLKGF
jgi:hypothetical protein